MATYQRRHGLMATIWKTEIQTDDRGNKVQVAVPANPHQVKVWISHQRSARAEVPGQMEIDVLRIGCDPNLEGVNLWSRVEVLGKTWDVVTPPAYRHGSGARAHVRHWSIDLRARP